MSALATAQRWLATHRTQAIAGGGASIVGLALYRRHRGSVAPASSATAPMPAGAALDPSSAAATPTFSDVDAALLDSDLTGISGVLDSIRATLGRLTPGGGLSDHQKHVIHQRNEAAKKKRKKPKPKPRPAVVTRAAQQRAATAAARARMTSLPTTAATAAPRPVANPQPVNSTRLPAPIAGQVRVARTLAPPSPLPAAPVRRFVAGGGPTRISR